MTQPRTDHNDLARFLDGSLAEEERSRALAHLSASDEDADVLAEAAFMLRELEAEDGLVVPDADTGEDADADPIPASDVPAGTDVDAGDPKVIPLRPPSTQRARRRVPAQWLALAAVLAGVLLVLPRAMSRGGDIRDPIQLAGLSENYDSLTTGWADRDRWSRTRGTGVVAEDDARDARLGALLLDLQLAVKGRQVEETQSVTREIKNTLTDVPGSGSLIAPYDQIEDQAGAPPDQLAQPVMDGYENVGALVDKKYFAAGQWIEAAQIAAAARDEAFFRSADTRRELDRIADLTMPAEGLAAARKVRAAAEGEAPLAWEALTKALDQLGRAIWD